MFKVFEKGSWPWIFLMAGAYGLLSGLLMGLVADFMTGFVIGIVSFLIGVITTLVKGDF